MKEEDLDTIIESGEGQYTEFKSKANNIAKEMVAFANSSGGKLIIGINDEGEYTQLSNLNKEKSRVRDAARNCDEPVRISEIEEVDGRLIVNIPESSQAHRCSKGWFIREGANSQKQNKEEIIKLMQRKKDIQFGNSYSPRFNYPEDFDSEAYEEFLAEADITSNIPPEDLLENLGVLEVDDNDEINFTNAGILMFAKNPKKFFAHAEIICNSYQSEDKVEIKDREVIEDPIIPSIRKSITFVKENIGTRYVIKDIKRQEVLEIPTEVLREAIVNAIMHRDYHNNNESIHIDIFPDKVEIRNPGGLVAGMREEDLGRKSMRRNQILANLLDKAEFVERSGTGINRMKKRMRENKLAEPDFDANSHFQVTLYRGKNQVVPDLSDEDLNERQEDAISHLFNSDKITSAEYQNLAQHNISRKTALRDLNELIEKGWIKRKGHGSDTHYVLNKER